MASVDVATLHVSIAVQQQEGVSCCVSQPAFAVSTEVIGGGGQALHVHTAMVGQQGQYFAVAGCNATAERGDIGKCCHRRKREAPFARGVDPDFGLKRSTAHNVSCCDLNTAAKVW